MLRNFVRGVRYVLGFSYFTAMIERGGCGWRCWGAVVEGGDG